MEALRNEAIAMAQTIVQNLELLFIFVEQHAITVDQLNGVINVMNTIDLAANDIINPMNLDAEDANSVITE